MRIKLKDVEQNVDELTGYWKGGLDPAKNPYKASRLHDDDYNFVSGVNYALSYLTDLFLDNVDDYIDDDNEFTQKIKASIATKTIEDFAQFGYGDLDMVITACLESEEYDEDWKRWEQEDAEQAD